MRVLLILSLFIFSLTAFAAEDCERINDSRRTVVEKKAAALTTKTSARTTLRK